MENLLNLLIGNIGIITGFILGLGVIAPFVMKAHGKIHDLAALINEIDASLDDGKIDAQEIKEIIADAKIFLGLK